VGVSWRGRGSGIGVLGAVLLDLHVLEFLDVGGLFCSVVLLGGVGRAGERVVVVGEWLLLGGGLLRVYEVQGALSLGGGDG
jgi:hypothetical protein